MDAPRRCECSDVARMAYGACASDGRSADAWTERAPILRGTEGVKIHSFMRAREWHAKGMLDHTSWRS